MTNSLNRTLIKKALGQHDDKYYKERVNNGFEWCKRWLIKNQNYHGLELNSDMIEALKEVVTKETHTTI